MCACVLFSQLPAVHLASCSSNSDYFIPCSCSTFLCTAYFNLFFHFQLLLLLATAPPFTDAFPSSLPFSFYSYTFLLLSSFPSSCSFSFLLISSYFLLLSPYFPLLLFPLPVAPSLLASAPTPFSLCHTFLLLLPLRPAFFILPPALSLLPSAVYLLLLTPSSLAHYLLLLLLRPPPPPLQLSTCFAVLCHSHVLSTCPCVCVCA